MGRSRRDMNAVGFEQLFPVRGHLTGRSIFNHTASQEQLINLLNDYHAGGTARENVWEQLALARTPHKNPQALKVLQAIAEDVAPQIREQDTQMRDFLNQTGMRSDTYRKVTLDKESGIIHLMHDEAEISPRSLSGPTAMCVCHHDITPDNRGLVARGQWKTSSNVCKDCIEESKHYIEYLKDHGNDMAFHPFNELEDNTVYDHFFAAPSQTAFQKAQPDFIKNAFLEALEQDRAIMRHDRALQAAQEGTVQALLNGLASEPMNKTYLKHWMPQSMSSRMFYDIDKVAFDERREVDINGLLTREDYAEYYQQFLDGKLPEEGRFQVLMTARIVDRYKARQRANGEGNTTTPLVSQEQLYLR